MCEQNAISPNSKTHVGSKATSVGLATVEEEEAGLNVLTTTTVQLEPEGPRSAQRLRHRQPTEDQEDSRVRYSGRPLRLSHPRLHAAQPALILRSWRLTRPAMPSQYEGSVAWPARVLQVLQSGGYARSPCEGLRAGTGVLSAPWAMLQLPGCGDEHAAPSCPPGL